VSWATIVGQPLAVRLLRRASEADRVAHAYLFVGPEGVGKRTAAWQLARVLLCAHRREAGDPCGQCPSCSKLGAWPSAHPDFLFIGPEGRFIKTDQIRQLQSEMYARPSEGSRRIAVIDGADRLNQEAGNRALKLLEEPPDYVVLILLAQNIAGVLPTLVSRCQVVHFPPVRTQAVAEMLVGTYGVEPAQAHLFAALSGGSFGRALTLQGDAGVQERRQQTLDLLLKLPQMDDPALLGQAEGLEKQKENIAEWLDMLTIWLRDSLLVAQGVPEQLVINTDRLPAVYGLSRTLGSERLLQMLAALSETRVQLQRNANTRLVLDLLLLKLAETSVANTP
jgi:DNA polymerase-3 subunit delta'